MFLALSEMIVSDFYRRLIKNVSGRPCSYSELRSVADRITKSSEHVEERIHTAVVWAYKAVESLEESDADYVYGLLSGFREDLADSLFRSGRVLPVRKDPEQLYLSVSTVLWHIDILLGRCAKKHLESFVGFMRRDVKLSLTYSQNIGRAALVLCYVRFREGDEQGFADCSQAVFQYANRLSRNFSSGSALSSTAIGDYMKFAGVMQCISAGREWLEGLRHRDSLWSSGAVVKRASRVGVEEFNTRFVAFLDAI